jgi:hypothetical protein
LIAGVSFVDDSRVSVSVRGVMFGERNPFVAEVQTTTEGQPQKVRFKTMRFTKAGIQDWARWVLVPDAEVYNNVPCRE